MALLLSAIVGLEYLEDAKSQIIVTSNIDELCKLPPATYRKTVVYVDLSSIRPGETEWGLTLVNKLELAPRETITILGVNPSTFEVSEVLDTCYPALSREELNATQDGRGLWDKLTKLDPNSQQRENLQTFDARIRNSLDKLVTAANKTTNPRRNILGAIAVDKNRMRDTHLFYRVIIYTDGMIADPAIGSPANESEFIRSLNEKYTTSLSGADVAVYGVTGSDKDIPLEAKARVFSAFLTNNWARLRSFAPSLPQQRNEPFLPVAALSGTFDGGGVQGNAKLMIAAIRGTADTGIWVTFGVGSTPVYVPFQGEYACRNEKCELTAVASENIPVGSSSPFFRAGDQLKLTGTQGKDLEGLLRPDTREVFKEASKEVQYSLRFRQQ